MGAGNRFGASSCTCAAARPKLSRSSPSVDIPAPWPTAVFRTIYVWRREYGPADACAGRSATAFAVTLYTSGAATARIAERSLGARSLCMATGPSRRLR
jgi:hypothetical protein